MKVFLKVLLTLVLLLLIFVGGYVIYLEVTYFRTPDMTELTINDNKENNLEYNKEYKIMTYNVGFGAYSKDYSFFMDKSEMLDGTKTKGKYSRGISEEDVTNNINGAIGYLKAENPDFILTQEVDTSSTRSFHINQANLIEESFPGYASVFTSNFHTKYLPYPFTSPHGIVNSGLLTMSKYGIDKAYHRQLPITTNFVEKFFDLDRALLESRYKIGDKELVIINAHFSAYDKGGVIRGLQLEMLNEILAEEKNAGNYVIVGGDFNHDISNSIGVFPTEQKTPQNIAKLNDDDLVSGYTIVNAGNKVSTCRDASIPYQKGVNYETVYDGFIISDNIKCIEIRNIDTSYEFTDHNPVVLSFLLEE